MKNRYEALLALDLRGKEEGAKELIERLEGEIKAEGAEIEQVQRLEKREMAYEHAHIKQAYYVNFVFEGDSSLPETLGTKFKLDPQVLLQHYQRLPGLKTEAAES